MMKTNTQNFGGLFLTVLMRTISKGKEFGLEGQAYNINIRNVLNDQVNIKDVLEFKDGVVTSQVYKHLGFGPPEYKSFTKLGETFFNITGKGVYGGTLLVSGVVKKNRIEGMFTRLKSGELEVKWNFAGHLANM